MPDQAAEFIHKQLQFTANLREPNRYPMPTDVDPIRMKLYQDLIFQNILVALTRAFPILSSSYGTHNWEVLVRDFLSIHKSKGPTHHEIPEEFLHYLSYVRRQPNDPPWTYELAHYEWLELCIGLSPLNLAEVSHNYSGNLLNDIPVVSPLAWIQAYQFPVHTITDKNLPQLNCPAPTYLIVYRNWKDMVEFMNINDFTHALLSLLNQENNTLTGREALSSIAKLTNHPNPAMVIQGGSLLLENLRERHIILGTKPC